MQNGPYDMTTFISVCNTYEAISRFRKPQQKYIVDEVKKLKGKIW